MGERTTSQRFHFCVQAVCAYTSIAQRLCCNFLFFTARVCESCCRKKHMLTRQFSCFCVLPCKTAKNKMLQLQFLFSRLRRVLSHILSQLLLSYLCCNLLMSRISSKQQLNEHCCGVGFVSKLFVPHELGGSRIVLFGVPRICFLKSTAHIFLI